MDKLRAVARGVTPEGASWELRVGGQDSDFATFVRAWDEAGTIEAGGMRGPLVPTDGLLSVYTGGGDRGPRFIVVRAHPSVDHLQLKTAAGRIELPLLKDPREDRVRFGVACVARETKVTALRAKDAADRTIDERDLSGHQRSWDHFRRLVSGESG